MSGDISGKKFDVEDIIDLPNHTVKHNIDGFTIILAPQYPNWIVLDEEELTLYNGLERGNYFIKGVQSSSEENEI